MFPPLVVSLLFFTLSRFAPFPSRYAPKPFPPLHVSFPVIEKGKVFITDFSFVSPISSNLKLSAAILAVRKSLNFVVCERVYASAIGRNHGKIQAKLCSRALSSTMADIRVQNETLEALALLNASQETCVCHWWNVWLVTRVRIHRSFLRTFFVLFSRFFYI